MGRPRSMAKIRTIKPELWNSQNLGSRSVLARLNFIGLFSLADDEGRGRGESRFLLGHLHPYAEAVVSEAAFVESLNELEAAELVAFYSNPKGFRFYALPGWTSHQYIKDPSPSELPPVPSDHPLARLFSVGLIPDKSRFNTPGPDRKGPEGKGRDNAGAADLSREEEEALRMPWPIRGDYYLRQIMDIPADYCAWALRDVKKLGERARLGCQARVKIKALESSR